MSNEEKELKSENNNLRNVIVQLKEEIDSLRRQIRFHHGVEVGVDEILPKMIYRSEVIQRLKYVIKDVNRNRDKANGLMDEKKFNIADNLMYSVVDQLNWLCTSIRESVNTELYEDE